MDHDYRKSAQCDRPASRFGHIDANAIFTTAGYWRSHQPRMCHEGLLSPGVSGKTMFVENTISVEIEPVDLELGLIILAYYPKFDGCGNIAV